MDLSALIFVALAVAWAVYLVPKALKHQDEVDETRTVDKFSHTMRVLARREPVDRSSTRLVVTPGRPASTATVVTDGPAEPPVESPVVPTVEPPVDDTGGTTAPVEVAVEATIAVTRPVSAKARRSAAARAAQRRRRVLSLITLSLAVVASLAAVGVLHLWYVALPAGLLVAWLVACRLMVRQERAVRTGVAGPVPKVAVTAGVGGGVTGEIAVTSAVPADAPAGPTTGPDGGPAEAEQPRVVTSQVSLDPTLWDPVPVTLPTYVSKPAATRRTVRTIDLDDTGVWTSGRTEADSQLAREADQAQRAERDAAKRETGGPHAVGS